MARSLPIENATDAIGTALAEFSGTVVIYDPAMCCATGACGPAPDPALLVIARDLRWLQSHGATVRRHGLSQEPAEFVKEPKVTGLMQAFGDAALPATLVNGDVVVYGRYPSRDEIVTALGATPDASVAARSGSEGACCTPGSSCC